MHNFHNSPKNREYFADEKKNKKKKHNSRSPDYTEMATSWSTTLHDKKIRILFDIKLFQNFETYLATSEYRLTISCISLTNTTAAFYILNIPTNLI